MNCAEWLLPNLQLIADRLDIGTWELDGDLKKNAIQRIDKFTRFSCLTKPKIAVFFDPKGTMQIPSPDNNFQLKHASLLRSSFLRLLGRELLPDFSGISTVEFAQRLFESPAVVVSHGTEDDPIFNYGNQTALSLFEMDWEDFTRLPSRKSAEPLNRQERARLLDAVSSQGFVDDYSGVRISAKGRRFQIPKAIVWNVVDEQGELAGQAATFSNWHFL